MNTQSHSRKENELEITAHDYFFTERFHSKYFALKHETMNHKSSRKTTEGTKSSFVLIGAVEQFRNSMEKETYHNSSLSSPNSSPLLFRRSFSKYSEKSRTLDPMIFI